MSAAPLSRVIRHLHAVAGRQEAGDAADGRLLDLFLAHRDEAAFAELVRRHGPMVLAACRRVLGGREADADDCFQATFLVLVRRAAAVRPRDRVGSFLYGVACRTALEARRAAARRRAREARAVPRVEPADDPGAELREALDREVARLPDRYRAAVVLCDLEGLSRKDAAVRLGWPEGTVSSRLARARSLLARRLRRHGPALSALAAAGTLARCAGAAGVPGPLAISTVRAATAVAAGEVAAGVSAGTVALTEAFMKSVLLAKLRAAAAAVLALAAVAAAAGFVMNGVRAAPPAAAAAQAPAAEDAPGGPERPADGGAIPLGDAVRAFNRRAAESPVGKDQPPLTEEEVVAAIRWALLPGDKLRVSDETRRALRVAADIGKLPPDFELEVISRFEPDDEAVFTAWSVRLRVPAALGGTTCVMVRERMLGSRRIGPEEHKVIRKWRDREKERGGVGSMERAEWERRYEEERAEAAEKDRAGKP